MIKLGVFADLLVALRRVSRYIKDHESWIKYKRKGRFMAGSDGGRTNGSNSHSRLLRSLCNMNFEYYLWDFSYQSPSVTYQINLSAVTGKRKLIF